MPLPLEIALIALVVLAAASDVRSREIPNWLTAAGILAGFSLHIYRAGWGGAKFAALGFGLACLLFLPLFFLRWLGGGDAKLMIAIGALSGWQMLLVIFILDAIFGGLAAAVLMLVKGRIRRTFLNMGRMIRALLQGRAPWKETPELEAGATQSLGMPRAVTIALSTVLVVWAL